ncbi:MAG: biotin/lipoyl-binding protein [Bacteroidales bacterium]|nr:biotin/lipoyl-binding protein [Candidatus Cryptobacteroides onthequi]
MKEYRFKINGNEYNVCINSIEGTEADVTVNGRSYSVGMESSAAQVQPAPAVHTAPVAQTAAPVRTQAPGAPAKAAGAGRAVTAPLPGVIIEVSVSAGQTVKAGQKVAVLEAMKMENEIQALEDGTVTAIHVSKGDSVLEGADIVTIA